MGDKTITGEQIIEVDGINLVGLGIGCDNDYGTVNEVIVKDVNNNISWGNAPLADNSVTTSKIADTAVTTAKIADGAITSGKLEEDINILGGYAQFTGESTGIGLSVTNNIECAGIIKTDNIDNRTGSNINVQESLQLAADKSVNLQGIGSVLLTGNGIIQTTTGDIRTPTLDTPSTGGDMTVKSNLLLDSNKSVSTQGAGGIVALGNGLIQSTTGSVRTPTFDTPVLGGNMSVGCNFAFASNKGIDTQGAGGFVALGNGIIQTTTGDIRTPTLDTPGLGGNMVVGCNINLNTDKSINTQGAGGIVALGNGLIQSTTGSVRTPTLDTPTPGGNMAVGCGLTIATGKTISVNTISKTDGTDINIANNLNTGVNSITTHGLTTGAGGIDAGAHAITCNNITANGTDGVKTNKIQGSVDTTSSISISNPIIAGSTIDCQQLTATSSDGIKTQYIQGVANETSTIEIKNPLLLKKDVGTEGNIALGLPSGGKYLYTDNISQRTTNAGTTFHAHINTGGGVYNDDFYKLSHSTHISFHDPTYFNQGLDTDEIHPVDTSAETVTFNAHIDLGSSYNLNNALNITSHGLVSSENLTVSHTGGEGTHTSVIFQNLPTSAAGLSTGQLYNDSGTLKIA